ncbi:MAG TPA: gliding motility-associated ABC transporter substrate-binding protein GldG [Cyclobacteriaceae bacterium]|nr:gliding motility-associated ABC transporter substrate-binding protein GldG [Cyclobacteriaceae bacterium]HMV08830.1 gliding motility-associated ABC transporter substrate-binding protein GldG [Cyclobacteriaceae bacterium]HMV90764.1 gliding motility-associated ABC transporter substrate-binding protein GldG [Cyclobacteriaceae bacterium]HMW99976.1 gliding motility-associated ABC transporter substrate-binding protein GldG [Cyclobacteriaceae bacterium]HMX49161.1 gliding motility-associated ABC tran
MVKFTGKRTGDLLLLANGLVLIVLLNVIASQYFFRVDLTEEKRFSIKDQTKEVLRDLDDNVFVEVYLEGDLNAGFRRMQKSIRETLEEFRIYSNNKVQFVFIDPSTAMSQKARNEYMQELMQKGVVPTNVVDDKDGQVSEKIIFPGVVISYGGFESGVNLLKGNSASTPEEKINQSIEGVEYQLANAIYKMVNSDRKRIGLITGHGELDSLEIASFNNALLELYSVVKVDLKNKKSLERYDALIIAKPVRAYSESDKYKLDQYIMNGGKVLFLLDKLEASMDSASSEGYFAFPYNVNLDDQLFKYGIRLNMDLVQDALTGKYPVVTGEVDGKPKLQLMDWPFFPLINRYADHPITRNLDAVVTRFISTVDTVKATGIKKIPLMFTSQMSRRLSAPVAVNINDVRKNLKKEDFSLSYLPVGYLLEGGFTSLYKNRFLPPDADQRLFKDHGISTKLIVIADGDLARNDVNPRNGQPQQLGYDPFARYTFANEELLMNAVNYLVNEDGLIAARNKEVKIRPLDKEKVRAERTKWQIINIGLPLFVLLVYGVVRSFIRKRKYSTF